MACILFSLLMMNTWSASSRWQFVIRFSCFVQKSVPRWSSRMNFFWESIQYPDVWVRLEGSQDPWNQTCSNYKALSLTLLRFNIAFLRPICSLSASCCGCVQATCSRGPSFTASGPESHFLFPALDDFFLTRWQEAAVFSSHRGWKKRKCIGQEWNVLGSCPSRPHSAEWL